MRNIAVPVLMYHSVGIPDKRWIWWHLTCPYKTFEDQLRWLKKAGFTTITLYELHEYMKNGKRLPKNPIVLTFDDGYLDNWTFAYPLLKKYKMKATIFVNPEFVDPTRKPRPTLEDVWNKEIDIRKIPTTGYLSWKEMKIMIEEGLVDIQSHTMTHTWYFTSDKVIDFRHPGDPYIWMTWNENIHLKPYLQIDNPHLVKLGEPVYEHERAIAARRFYPDVNIVQYLIEYVKEDSDFFRRNDWKELLMKKYQEYSKDIEGRYETFEEYEARLWYEIQDSKRILERNLDKGIDFLCWPGGAVTPKALEIASEIGYLASTVGRDIPPNIRRTMKNRFGDSPSRINRIGSMEYWNGKIGEDSKAKYKSGIALVFAMYYFQEKPVLGTLGRLISGGFSVISRIFYNQLSE